MRKQKAQLGSAAIDNGDNAGCAAAPINNFDQRGATRVGLGTGAACDIGAVERQSTDSDVVPLLYLPLVVR